MATKKTDKKTTKKAPARAKAAAKTTPEAKTAKFAAKASKEGGKAEAPKAPAPKAPRRNEPPPKVRKRGKVKEVEFQSKEQIRDIAYKAVADDEGVDLTEKEIEEREEEVKKLLAALKTNRTQLKDLILNRDATKARIDDTPDGQRLIGLKESIKKKDEVIAALQAQHEEASWEASHGKTLNPQRELFRGVNVLIPEGKPLSAQARTASLPLDEAPPAPPAAPAPRALPPVTSGVIVEGQIEEIPTYADEVGKILQARGPLSIEAICGALGWEERDPSNWKQVQEALRALRAIKQDDGRWYLPEHLRALPPAPPPEALPAPLALPAAPSLSLEERLKQLAMSEESVRERLRGAVRLMAGATPDALHRLLGGDLDLIEASVEQLVEQGDLVRVGEVLYPAEVLSPTALREAVLADAKGGPVTAGALQGLLCPPHGVDALAEMLRALVASGDLVLGDDETYSLPAAPPPADGASEASAPARAPGRAARGAAAPSAAAAATVALAPPERPAKGHPQRVLRGWLWQTLSASSGMSAEDLSARATAFHREYIDVTLGLLDALGLVMEGDKGRVWWALDKGERGVDRVVLDEVAAVLVDEPLKSEQIASAMKVAHVLVWDILTELEEAGRVVREGNRWCLSDQGHEALKAAE